MTTKRDAGKGTATADGPSGTDLPEAMRTSFPFLLGQGAQRISDLAHESLGAFNLTLRHFGVLNLVGMEEGQIQRTVGARLGIDRTSIVTITDDLERAGLLERRRGTDRRAYELYLTPAGAAQLRQLRRLVELAQEDFLAPLDERERAALRSLLLRLL
ncbi:MarR family winged helix-turn-helix transcriptional regulator [Streptomyces sp. NK08204]|uniref:MarR family winged helix-turn-helix transcriptional regulator n=1 Tax=Streptomyces sp. NK08204 TaxID=2873260 RepID=UPI001CED90F8|nr:MarR family transcriptional regulator [Streptomyces sp. NK08204]